MRHRGRTFIGSGVTHGEVTRGNIVELELDGLLQPLTSSEGCGSTQMLGAIVLNEAHEVLGNSFATTYVVVRHLDGELTGRQRGLLLVLCVLGPYTQEAQKLAFGGAIRQRGRRQECATAQEGFATQSEHTTGTSVRLTVATTLNEYVVGGVRSRPTGDGLHAEVSYLLAIGTLGVGHVIVVGGDTILDGIVLREVRIVDEELAEVGDCSLVHGLLILDGLEHLLEGGVGIVVNGLSGAGVDIVGNTLLDECQQLLLSLVDGYLVDDVGVDAIELHILKEDVRSTTRTVVA